MTGEEVLELHVHGGPAIVKALLKAISICASPHSRIEYAEPGEFTWRGFLNGRLDLTQVEALGDTLDSVTEQQRKLSMRGVTGKLGKQYDAWRLQLLEARGELEALIDFQEDQHFDESPYLLAASVADQVKVLSQKIAIHVSNAVRGELLRNGICVALLGAPNVGKSSLLNRIVGRDAAIVSREAGTTRDIVEVGIDLGGYLCRLGDTAGLRTSADSGSTADGSATSAVGAVEQEGIRRAKERALDSDLVIVVLSIELDPQGEPHLVMDSGVISSAKDCVQNGSVIVVAINKMDLVSQTRRSSQLQSWKSALQKVIAVPDHRIFGISCIEPPAAALHNQDADSVRLMADGMLGTFADMTRADLPGEDTSDPFPYDQSVLQEALGASERHRLLLEDCLSHLDAFVAQVNTRGTVHEPDAICSVELDIVVAAESLRAAADCLARITGRGEAGDIEEVLGVVFSK